MAGKKDGRHGGEIRVSRIGWGAGQDRIAAGKEDCIRGIEGSGGEATAFAGEAEEATGSVLACRCVELARRYVPDGGIGL